LCIAAGTVMSSIKGGGFLQNPSNRVPVKEVSNYRCAELLMANENSGDAIDLLTEDHKKVKQLFKDFAQLKGTAPTAAMIDIAQAICTELTIHAAIEEELFYPAARKAINDGGLIDEAEIEHATVKFLIKQLMPAKEGDAQFTAKVTVLREYTKHHINEEENEMFPKIKQAKADLSALGQQLRDRKKQLQDQLKTPEQVVAFSSS
jgi:hemerythrin superfamily protein